MEKLKPIEQILKDVKKGDLVRLPLKEKDGRDAGYFVDYYSGRKSSKYKIRDKTFVETWIGFNSRSQGAELGYSSGARFCIEKGYFSGGQMLADNYEILKRAEKKK